MLVLVRTSSTVSILSMHKVRMLLLVSVLHSRLQKKALFVGLHSKILMKRLVQLNTLQWKRLCLSCTSSSMHSKISWRSTTMICRIWSLPYKKVNFGSSKLVMVSVLVLQWLRLLWISFMRVRLMRRLHLCVVSQTNLTNFFTQYLIRRLWHRHACWHVVCQLLQVLQVVRLCSLLMMLQSGTMMAVKLSWFVSKHLQKTLQVCLQLRVSWLLVVVWLHTLLLLHVVWVSAVSVVLVLSWSTIRHVL